MRGRLNQGVAAEYPSDKITDPLRESLIFPEAQGLHLMGALSRTHVRQEERELSSVTSIKARRQTHQQDPLPESLIRTEARGLHPMGALARTHMSLIGARPTRVTST
jgi:hypothetical protein